MLENIEKQDNKILLISEKEQQVFLPYTLKELEDYLDQFPDAYSSIDDVIKKEFVLTLQAFNEDEEKNEAHQYCTGNIKPEDIKKLPIINKKNTYTDTIIAEFTDAEFKTKDGNVSNIRIDT